VSVTNPWVILLAVLIFGFLIFIHELGHYLFARLFRVTVREFAIGMGPKLFSHRSSKNGIVYSLRALPIGGYVSMEGEDMESDDENAFHKKPVWQRIVITAAGAMMNIVIGIVVMCILVGTQEVLASNTIGVFTDANNVETEETERGGLMIGDTILAVDGTRVHIANETVYEIMRKGVDPLDIKVLRDGERITVENVVFSTITDSGTTYGDTNFKFLAEEKTFINVVKHSVFRSTSTIKMIWESIFDLISGRYGVESGSGPIGVTQALGEAAKQGIGDLMYLAVIITMNLGVMNLLPLPALDGGRLLFQLIELVRGKPVKTEIEGYIHFAGLVLLMLLMVFVTFKDIVSLI